MATNDPPSPHLSTVPPVREPSPNRYVRRSETVRVAPSAQLPRNLHARSSSESGSPPIPILQPVHSLMTMTALSPAVGGFHKPSSPYMLQGEELPAQPVAGPSQLRKTPRNDIRQSFLPSPGAATAYNSASSIPPPPSSVRPHTLSAAQHRSHRCSPACTAATPPYKLLTQAIGRASALGMRHLDKEISGHLQQHEPITPPIGRIALQTRRSRSRSSTMTPPESPQPLYFDRKILEYTPPLPSDDSKTTRQDYFTPAIVSNQTPVLPSNAWSLQALQDPDFDIPRSASVPTMTFPSHQKRLSLESPAAKEPASAWTQHHKRRDLLGSKFVLPESPMPQRPAKSAGDAVPPTNRSSSAFAVMSSRNVSGSSVEDVALDLSAYLEPELSAALKQRIEQRNAQQPSVGRQRERKEQPATEADWSFNAPIAESIITALDPVLPVNTDISSFQITENGCSSDLPNPVIKHVVTRISHSPVALTVTHNCPATFDIRALRAAIKSHSTSYKSSIPGTKTKVLSNFSFTEFGEVAFPAGSIDLAIGGAGLTRLQGIPASKLGSFGATQSADRDALAARNMKEWLGARAKEAKSGGLVVFHVPIWSTTPGYRYLQHTSPKENSSSLLPSPAGSPTLHGASIDHSESPSSVTSKTTEGIISAEDQPDLWHRMIRALSPAIQRLVSLGEIRTHIAPILLDSSHWPRSLEGIHESLIASQAEWDIATPMASSTAETEDESSGKYPKEEVSRWLEAGVRISRLSHPAWIAFEDGKIDRSTYARRMAMYCRSVYEVHLKTVLRERGKMDVSQCESTVQELFKILVEKCEAGALDNPELDIGVVVLRRK